VSKALRDFYNKQFFSSSEEGMSNSASIALKYLFSFFQPKSIIDIGCGQGAWLAAADQLGVKTLKGLDGEWIDESELLSDRISFQRVNFEKELPESDAKHDLCISLEVAEHISEPNAEKFVAFLCSTSDVVLFSAAICQQEGTNHVNEQWQSYWIAKFKANGYECFDVMRPALWDVDEVKRWYRQNMFLFVREGSTCIDQKMLRDMEKPIPDLVHPESFRMAKRIGHGKKHSQKIAIRWAAIGFLAGVAVSLLK